MTKNRWKRLLGINFFYIKKRNRLWRIPNTLLKFNKERRINKSLFICLLKLKFNKERRINKSLFICLYFSCFFKCKYPIFHFQFQKSSHQKQRTLNTDQHIQFYSTWKNIWPKSSLQPRQMKWKWTLRNWNFLILSSTFGILLKFHRLSSRASRLTINHFF